MTPSQKYLQKLGLKDQDTIEITNEIKPPHRGKPPPFFFKKICIGWHYLRQRFHAFAGRRSDSAKHTFGKALFFAIRIKNYRYALLRYHSIGPHSNYSH